MSAILLQCCNGTAKILKCGCEAAAATSCQDVAITAIICVAITIIATYGLCRFFTFKEHQLANQQQLESDKHSWEVEEKGKKHEAGLLEKKLQLLNDLCYQKEERIDYKNGKEQKNYVKSLLASDSKEVNNYLAALNIALGITSESPK